MFTPFVRDVHDLESKAWHRFLKIAYYFSLVGIFFYLCSRINNSYEPLLNSVALRNDWASYKILARERLNNYLFNLIPTYLAALVIQFFYYKIFLYIIYGKK